MSDNLSFQDTPLYAWLKSNVWLLLGGFVVLLAILLYRENAPAWRQAGFDKSWDKHRALVNSPEGLADLSTRLAESRQDPRIHPWIVFEAAYSAAEVDDQAALALLKPELEALAKNPEVHIAGEAGNTSLAGYLLSTLYGDQGKLPKNPAAPAPDGGRIEITLKGDGDSTYALVVGLYEASAPMGTAALKKWASDGRFTEQSARKVGSLNLNLTLAPLTAGESGADEPGAEHEPLNLERAFGYFHSEGVLATALVPSKANVQDENNLQIFLGNSYTMDGQTTVLGKVVEGWQALKDALDAAGPTAEFKVVGARLLE